MVESNVPKDLLIHILVRLPVKSLVRFKLVSKSCNALITDPSFINEYLHFSKVTAKNHPQHLVFHIDTITRKPRSSLLLSRELTQPFIDLPLPFPEDLAYLTPYDHCNGIFCLYGVCPPAYHYNRFHVTLWNPATREYKVLPLPHRLPVCGGEFFLHGFGIDPTTNNYKVVSIVLKIFSLENEHPFAEVYNLGTDYWKIIRTPVPAFDVQSARFRSYLNGVFHWLTKDHNDESVLCFDFSNHAFSKMKLPPSFGNLVIEEHVLVLNDHLSCVTVYGALDHWYEIWDMDEYGVEESWNKKYALGPQAYFGTFLGFWNEDEILTVEDESLLVLHNIQTEQAERSGIHVEPIMFYCFSYVESLVRLSV